MSFDWSEYLKLARELAGQTTTPSNQDAKLRSAISRAYYSAFCKARNHLHYKEGHKIPVSGEAHTYVRDEFKNSADKSRRGIGNRLNRLWIDRKKADYEDVVTGLSSTASLALKLAGRVISVLNNL